VTLGLFQGEIRINNLNRSLFSYDILKVHKSPLECFAMNFEGTLLATASVLGTIIRIFDLTTKLQTHELKRGFDPAVICSMTFHDTSEWFAVSSSLLTVHIFHLANEEKFSKNQKSSFHFLKSFLPKDWSNLVSREWSFQHFQIPYQPFLLIFANSDYHLCLLTQNGHYYKVRFNPNDKEDLPLQLEHQIFTN
jgi:WD40 repeat protein